MKTILLGRCILSWVFSVILLIRNYRVYKMTDDMLKKISYASRNDIDKGKNWIWRYDTYASVSYDKMVLQFWKPLKPEAFYKNTSFLKIEKIEND